MADREVQPHVVRLRPDAAGWRRDNGPELTPDEPFLTGLTEEAANGLVQSQWALIHATVEEAEEHRFGTRPLPFDPSDLTVSDLEAKLQEEDLTREQLDAAYEAEEAGENRTTALEAIEETHAVDEPVDSSGGEAEAEEEAVGDAEDEGEGDVTEEGDAIEDAAAEADEEE